MFYCMSCLSVLATIEAAVAFFFSFFILWWCMYSPCSHVVFIGSYISELCPVCDIALWLSLLALSAWLCMIFWCCFAIRVATFVVGRKKSNYGSLLWWWLALDLPRKCIVHSTETKLPSYVQHRLQMKTIQSKERWCTFSNISVARAEKLN